MRPTLIIPVGARLAGVLRDGLFLLGGRLLALAISGPAFAFDDLV
jgi:hypothetical protein